MRIGRVDEWIWLFRRELGVSKSEATTMVDRLVDEKTLIRHPCGQWGIKWRLNSLSDVALRGPKPAGLQWTLDDEERLLERRERQ